MSLIVNISSVLSYVIFQGHVDCRNFTLTRPLKIQLNYNNLSYSLLLPTLLVRNWKMNVYTLWYNSNVHGKIVTYSILCKASKLSAESKSIVFVWLVKSFTVFGPLPIRQKNINTACKYFCSFNITRKQKPCYSTWSDLNNSPSSGPCILSEWSFTTWLNAIDTNNWNKKTTS